VQKQNYYIWSYLDNFIFIKEKVEREFPEIEFQGLCIPSLHFISADYEGISLFFKSIMKIVIDTDSIMHESIRYKKDLLHAVLIFQTR